MVEENYLYERSVNEIIDRKTQSTVEWHCFSSNDA